MSIKKKEKKKKREKRKKKKRKINFLISKVEVKLKENTYESAYETRIPIPAYPFAALLLITV